MIIEVPTPEAYFEASLSHFHLAWDIGVNLASEIENSGIDEWDDDGAGQERYWTQVKPNLSNAFNMIQQAQEFALKGRVAEVSPYLLLARDQRDKPKNSDKVDVPFSAFRTIDSSDLFRLHNTVCKQKLPLSFGDFFDEVRRRRNALMHHGPSAVSIGAPDILVAVLKSYKILFSGNWASLRMKRWNEGSLATLYSNKYMGDAALSELSFVVKMLKPAILKEHFGYHKNRRTYLCPECQGEARNLRGQVALAQLTSKDAAEIYCFVCGRTYAVTRQRCFHADCASDVLCDYDYYQEYRGAAYLPVPHSEKVCLLCDREQKPNHPAEFSFPAIP